MAKMCFTPGEAGAPRWACIRFGRVMEWVIKQEYCLAKGGCDEYRLGGGGVDFFDENSTTTRCRFLASYLVTHHPLLDQEFISGSCEVRKRPVDPEDDENERFAVPDIITDDPGGRVEFYEIKPNSESGRRAGKVKIDTFLSLVDFLKETDPKITYEKGTQFDPDRTITFYRRNYLGIIPCEASIHYKRLEDGLIVYEICVSVDGELLEQLAKAIIVSAIIALLIAGAIVILGPLILSPAGVVVLVASVGPEADNDTQDVRYVQALVNDWRAGIGGPLIAIDGFFSDEVAGAISEFQSASGLGDTAGSVIPGDATIAGLEQVHLDNVSAATDPGEFQLDATGDFVYREVDEEIDLEAGDELLSQNTFDAAVRQYLQLLHDSV